MKNTFEKILYRSRMCKGVTNIIEELLDLTEDKQNQENRSNDKSRMRGEEVSYPFHTGHIDHKGPLNPMSEEKPLFSCDQFVFAIKI